MNASLHSLSLVFAFPDYFKYRPDMQMPEEPFKLYLQELKDVFGTATGIQVSTTALCM